MHHTVTVRCLLKEAGNRIRKSCKLAVPVTNDCALPGAAISGELTGSPIPIPSTDGALCLADEVIYGEAWAARHNAEIWGAWCNDATGYSFED